MCYRLWMNRNETKQAVGILAYGSLVGDPGSEIDEVRTETIEGLLTPFPVEFARQSGKTRGGAPTLVPYEGGAPVRAQLFVVNTSIDDATNRLYRRETRKIGTGERYEHSDSPGPNKVTIKRLGPFAGIDVVLYAQIGANIDDLGARTLAALAIASVGKAEEGLDGISYLMDAIANGIETPLTSAYAEAVTRECGANDLPGALAKARTRFRGEGNNR
jgi:hypothetical protein